MQEHRSRGWWLKIKASLNYKEFTEIRVDYIYCSKLWDRRVKPSFTNNT